MKFSADFIKTKKTVSKKIESKNAQLLTRGGFIHQELSGVYTYLPLGVRVLSKIEDIVRNHMNTVSSEVFMPSLHPVSKWKKTDRFNSVDVLFKAIGANKESAKKNDSEYVLAPTHEEIITPLVQEYVSSYRDLPVALYQIQTKFRNEPRAKSGLLRGREFRMKDLYSFHKDENDFKEYYENIKKVYANIFSDLGLGEDTFVTVALGGDFTKEFSNEFQTLIENGEDTIYLDRKNKIAYNKEIVEEENAKKFRVKFKDLEEVKASEVGNIFKLDTKYSKAFGFTYTDEKGKEQPIPMGCYGLGTSRVMGVIVEKMSDENGIVWPESIAPFKYHLITIGESEEVMKKARDLYENHKENVLWDDRFEVSPGQKLAEADLIGCPIRVVVSEKSLKSDGVEVKRRDSEKAEIVRDLP